MKTFHIPLVMAAGLIVVTTGSPAIAAGDLPTKFSNQNTIGNTRQPRRTDANTC